MIQMSQEVQAENREHVQSQTMLAAVKEETVEHRVFHVCFISPLGHGLYQPGANSSFGGAEVQLYLLAGALAKDPQFRVSVLTTVSENPGREQCGAISLFKRVGRNRLTSKGPWPLGQFWKALKGWVAAFREMKQVFREIDADVYVHAGAGIEVGAYALISKLLRRQFIFIVASPYDVCAPYGNLSGSLKWLYPLGVSFADTVICRTRQQQQWLSARYKREGRLIRTGHPVPETKPTSPTTVLWVGRASDVKQPHLFLDLAEQTPGIHFTMVVMTNQAPEPLVQQIRSRAEGIPNLALHENIHVSEMTSFFQSAKLYVNTSRSEGFPNTFVQAAMHGIPILSWSVNPDEVLSEFDIGICVEESWECLIATTKRVYHSETLQREMGERGYRYAEEFHELTTTVSCFKDLFREWKP